MENYKMDRITVSKSTFREADDHVPILEIKHF